MKFEIADSSCIDKYVGQDVYIGTKLLASRGDRITKEILSEINKYKFNGIYTATKKEIEAVKRITEPELLSEITKKVYDDVLDIFQGDKEINGETQKKINHVTDVILNNVIKNKDALINISNLRSSNNYTYNHSINVAIISTLIATELKFPLSEIKNVGMAGLLHDIGKNKIPNTILDKPGALTDEEWKEMKKHSEYGYEMIEDNTTIPMSVKLGILQHHEKKDGTGYPNGITGKDIHPYAKIIAVADIYDALISKRAYHDSYQPSEALELLYASLDELDYNIIMAFKNCINMYPPGSLIKLSNGQLAVVVKSHKDAPLRPTVIMMDDDDYTRIDMRINMLNTTVSRRI